MNTTGEYVPPRLLLQWHVTNRCNLRCKHCYQQDFNGAEPSWQRLLTLLSQFEDLLSEWRAMGARVPGHITVTGGEPFVRSDLMDLLEEVHAAARFSFAILTNGTLVESGVACRLAKLRPRFVQVSIEGTPQTHDRLRGDGNHRQVVAAIRCLRKAGIRTFISFTAHRNNFREFPEVARLARRLGVHRVWTDRLIPNGAGATMNGVLSPDETREFLGRIRQAQTEAEQAWCNRTQISAHRALQFLICGGSPYHCTAGDSLLTVMPNGDVYPCRRMAVRVGNAFETPLRDIYYQSPFLHQLRQQNSISAGCESCCYNRVCRGGLRCLSYAVHADPLHADPGCWLSSLAGAGKADKEIPCST